MKLMHFFKKNHRISFAGLMTLLLVLSAGVPASAMPLDSTANRGVATLSQLNLYANIETVGVAVSGTNLPKTAQLMVRQSGDTAWRPAHPLMRIDDGRLIGSLFGLSPSTSYDVKVIDGTTEISGSTVTQPDELQFTPMTILYVNDDAPSGGDGTSAAPFRTIQEGVNRASAGTQVLVADGIYHEAISFPVSGNAGNWIQVKAEGNGAILDGSDQLAGNIWTPHASRGHVWFTKISSPISYLARDQQRFFKYDTLSGLLNSLGHGDVTMKEGWYFEPSTLRLYVRSLDDPAGHAWQVPRLNHAFDVISRDWIWIEGFEMQFYGASTGGCGVCAVNASHVVIRKNKIHNLQLGIFTNWNGGENQGNDIRIENNDIYDPPVNEWPWKAIKGSSMEGTAIVVRGHIGAIVRNNIVHNYFNGIYTGSSGALENSALAFDADIYHNYIHHISDDALEPEGACINHRFRNNTIDASFVGVSLAPITKGPVWVLQSSISNYTSKAIKWALNSDGIVLIYHNTSWTTAGNISAMDLITPAYNSVMRNNIFQSTGYAFAELRAGSKGNDWSYDNWYTTRGSNGPHFKWASVNYNTMAALCKSTRLECNGHESSPSLKDPTRGDFTLLSTSPNIDRGILIPGINDNYLGNAPDIGMFEYEASSNPAPLVSSILRADPNPTATASVNFTVSFTESVTGVDVVAPFNDFGITTSGIKGASITSVTPVSDTTYIVGVGTGTGNGTIRLDVIDNDSIIDAQGGSLGGAGAGNGSYISGEVYTINKPITNAVTVTFNSAGVYDGWILESGESTGVGGTLNKSATTFNTGDDPKEKQYRSILSFNTNSLPDNAVILSAQVEIKRQGVVGTDPFGTHGVLLLEIRNGPFGSGAGLDVGDFSAAAGSGFVQDQFSGLTFSWYGASLSSANLALINKYGVTQMRLFFGKDDNDDLDEDYVKFFSGDSISANMPKLIISYYLP